MYASVISAHIQSEDFSEGIQMWQEFLNTHLMHQEGYKGCYLLTDSKTGKVLVVNLWENEAYATAYETSGKYQQDVARFANVVRGMPFRQVYEVSVFA